MSSESEIVLGDSREVLQKYPDNNFSLLCTDPPYGIEMLGLDWDKTLPPKEIWRECHRILKPGAIGLVFSLPRQDVWWRLACDLEEVGFKTSFTPIFWARTSGVPKQSGGNAAKFIRERDPNINDKFLERFEDAYFGFQPKPVVECILVIMKPNTEPTYWEQAVKTGTAVSWLDNCRIPPSSENDAKVRSRIIKNGTIPQPQQWGVENKQEFWESDKRGRFPANLIVSENVLDTGRKYGHYIGNDIANFSRFFSLDNWAKMHCQFAIFPRVPNEEKWWFCSKCKKFFQRTRKNLQRHLTHATKDEMWRHKTQKPLKIMCYLIALGSQPGDKVIDPFAGTGTTAVAAKIMNRHFTVIEKDELSHKVTKIRVNRERYEFDAKRGTFKPSKSDSKDILDFIKRK